MSEGTEKKKVNRKTGPKPLYVLVKQADDGEIESLEVTRNAATATKFLSNNPGAQAIEKSLTA